MGAMSGTTCLVTGATSGIGKETALRLASLGATVIIVARDAARGAAAGAEITGRVPLAQVEVMTADLSSLAQVRRLAGDVLARHGQLDVLVNNAGVISPRRQLTADGLETTFATNHLGPFLLTSLLRGLLERSAPARVVTVSSAAHKQVGAIPWDDLPRSAQSGQAQAYPVSKLLNILFTAELARRLAGHWRHGQLPAPRLRADQSRPRRDRRPRHGTAVDPALAARPRPAPTPVLPRQFPGGRRRDRRLLRQLQACRAKRLGQRHPGGRAALGTQRRPGRPRSDAGVARNCPPVPTASSFLTAARGDILNGHRPGRRACPEFGGWEIHRDHGLPCPHQNE